MQGGGLGFSKADFHADEFFLWNRVRGSLGKGSGEGMGARPREPAWPAREAEGWAPGPEGLRDVSGPAVRAPGMPPAARTG